MSFTLNSEAFDDGTPIPRRFTCEGDNVSPPLAWSGAPRDALSFALVMEDLDARGFRHWVVFDIPAQVHRFEADLRLWGAGRLLANDTGRPRYDGPCPSPRDGVHRYRFTLFALNAYALRFRGDTRAFFEEAIASHVLATATLGGLYERS